MDREPVRLRDVEEGDFEIFFEHQLDPDATEMAAFPSRDDDAHIAHWRKISADDACITKAIVVGDTVAGNIGSWSQDGHREVGYWIGKEHWGKGIASVSAGLAPQRSGRAAHLRVGHIQQCSVDPSPRESRLRVRTDGRPSARYRIDG